MDYNAGCRRAYVSRGLAHKSKAVQTLASTIISHATMKSRSTAIAVFFLYVLAAITIASFGYGIGGTPALAAGLAYASAGLVLGFICVGFAPRFIVVVALATGLLGSIMRASTPVDIVTLIPKQSTVAYLRNIITICGAISFGGGLYGGFRFTGKGLFNWISEFVLKRAQLLDIKNPSLQEQLMRDMISHFQQSERMYFSLLAALASVLIAWFEVAATLRALVIIFLAVVIATNLMWAFGAWLKPRLRVLEGVFRILQQMWEALAAFLVGYVGIVLVFACFYAAAWQHNHSGAFHGVVVGPTPRFGDFLYFSIVTMSTVGYGDVFPSDAVTRALACFEVVLGVGWVTVVLSAAASLTRPKVDLVLRKEWAEAGESDPMAASPKTESTGAGR